MPLYDYVCRVCRHQFEALVRDARPVNCVACGANDPERQLSMFAVATEGTRQSSLKQARVEAKKVARDKAMAQHEYEAKHHH